jgi:hypothetical protein
LVSCIAYCIQLSLGFIALAPSNYYGVQFSVLEVLALAISFYSLPFSYDVFLNVDNCLFCFRSLAT